MTTAQIVETSVTNNSLSKDYLHPDDHAKQIDNIHMLLSLGLGSALGLSFTRMTQAQAQALAQVQAQAQGKVCVNEPSAYELEILL